MDTEQVPVFIRVVDFLWIIGRDLATNLVRHASLALGARVLPQGRRDSEREIFIDNLLVRVHYISVLILVDRPCTTGV